MKIYTPVIAILLLGLLIAVGIFVSTDLSVVDSNTYLQYDCGEGLVFFSLAHQACIEYPQKGYFCEDNLDALVEVETQSECNSIGGVWDLCPQCPQGRICPSNICEPQCSKGQTCQYESDKKELCYEFDEKIRNGQCVLDSEPIDAEQYQRNNETRYRCPGDYVRFDDKCVFEIYIPICNDGYNYNLDNFLCEKSASFGDFCNDGRVPEYDDTAKRYLCINNIELPDKVCPIKQVYNPEKDMCDTEVELYSEYNNEIVVADIDGIEEIQDANIIKSFTLPILFLCTLLLATIITVFYLVSKK